MKKKYNSWLCLLLLLGFVLLSCSQNNNIVSKDETTFQITGTYQRKGTYKQEELEIKMNMEGTLNGDNVYDKFPYTLIRPYNHFRDLFLVVTNQVNRRDV